jgi:hypothetical protein
MNLMCVDRTTIQFMLLPIFFCAGMAGVTLKHLPDKWGCVRTMRTFFTLSLVAQAVIIFVPNYWVRLISISIMGICNLKNSCTYLYIGGVVRAKDSSLCAGIINSFDTATVFLMGCYFNFISKDCFPLLVAQLLVGAMSCSFLSYVAPESPRWLIATGQRKKAI